MIRAQIADATLRPGASAPSGAALARITGFSTITCRKALSALIRDGVLVPGPSRNARPRVAGSAPDPEKQTRASAARALSAGLAARRRAAGLSQVEFAALANSSVTTVGHAETGRLWQSREFWERADKALSAGGDLLRLHETYRPPAAEHEPEATPATSADPMAITAPAEGTVTCITITWDDGTVMNIQPPARQPDS